MSRRHEDDSISGNINTPLREDLRELDELERDGTLYIGSRRSVWVCEYCGGAAEECKRYGHRKVGQS